MAYESTQWKPLRELSTFREDGDGDPSLLCQQTFMADEEEALKGDGDIFRMYFREVSKVPLLTREREIELARRIQRGQRKIHNLLLNSLASVGKIDRLDPESAKNHGRVVRSREEVVRKVIRRLEERAKHSGDDCNRFRDLLAELKKAKADLEVAKAEMVQSNLRLVVKVAKRYLNRGLSFLDLLQEGNLGLMMAVTKFDYRRGYKFSTYASWWIRQAISRAVADKSRTIRIPNHLLEMKGKISRVFHQFVKERGREPLPEEIASEAGIDPDKVHRVLHLTQEPLSLEAPVGEDSKLEDVIASEEPLSSIQDFIERLDLARKTRDLLSLLNPREEQILRLRLGIGEPTGHTLAEVGKRFGISRERVRQIQRNAVRKLKVQTKALAIYGEFLGDSTA
jgi:RNA polymerase primary sigma factor